MWDFVLEKRMVRLDFQWAKIKSLFKFQKMEQTLAQAYFLKSHLTLSVFSRCSFVVCQKLSEGQLMGRVNDEITTLEGGFEVLIRT